MTMANSFLPQNNAAQSANVVRKDNLTDVIQGPTSSSDNTSTQQPSSSAPTQPLASNQVVDATGSVIDLGLRRGPVIKK